MINFLFRSAHSSVFHIFAKAQTLTRFLRGGRLAVSFSKFFLHILGLTHQPILTLCLQSNHETNDCTSSNFVRLSKLIFSYPYYNGEGNGNPLQCSCLENIYILEKAMAPHSSTLAWKIPWTEEPGRLQSMGSLRVGHD